MPDTSFHRDSGKPRLDLIPRRALVEVARVMTAAKPKYGDRSKDTWWENNADKWDWCQLMASAERHIAAWYVREDMDHDPELEFPVYHLAQVIANVMMLLELSLLERGHDDRSWLKERGKIWAGLIPLEEVEGLVNGEAEKANERTAAKAKKAAIHYDGVPSYYGEPVPVWQCPSCLVGVHNETLNCPTCGHTKGLSHAEEREAEEVDEQARAGIFEKRWV